MKKSIVLLCMLMILLCGSCLETAGLIAGGAAGGMTAARIIQQQKENIQANIDLMEQQKIDLEAELAAATDDVEKERIQKQLDITNKVLADLEVSKVVVLRLEEGSKVDWQEPKSIIPFGASVLMTILWLLKRRKEKETAEDNASLETALTEVVKGGQKFKKAVESDGGIVKTFKVAMNDEQSAETKEMVAVIKA